jgi:hypothetical protein
MSAKCVVVGSQVSIGMGVNVKPYPIHSTENVSAGSFLFKRHIYSHTEKIGLSSIFSGRPLGAAWKKVRGLCGCFWGPGDDECVQRELVVGSSAVSSSAFSITSNDELLDDDHNNENNNNEKSHRED